MWTFRSSIWKFLTAAENVRSPQTPSRPACPVKVFPAAPGINISSWEISCMVKKSHLWSQLHWIVNNKKGFLPDTSKWRKPGSFQILKPSINLPRIVSFPAWSSAMISRLTQTFWVQNFPETVPSLSNQAIHPPTRAHQARFRWAASTRACVASLCICAVGILSAAVHPQVALINICQKNRVQGRKECYISKPNTLKGCLLGSAPRPVLRGLCIFMCTGD